MKLIWAVQAWKDYLYWQANDKSMLKKINSLLKETQRTLFEGTGKPEPLRFEFAGKWSRRINAEHRLVYEFKNDELIIFQCRYHY